MKPGFILKGQWGLLVHSITLLKVSEARLCLKFGPAETACTFTAVLKVSEVWGQCGILVLLSIAVLQVCEAKIHLALGPLE